MSDPDGMVEWLNAQLDDDERVARQLIASPGGFYLEAETEQTDLMAAGAHVFRWSPARVVREVEAKRRILAVIQRWTHYSCQDGWYSCSQATEENGFPADEQCADDNRAGEPCDCGLDWRRMVILAPLALPYADRPGYRSEWAPQ